MGAALHQLDVKTAFLNGVLEEPVFVEQPAGFERGNRKKKVWRLKKALYGLVEAPRLWYLTLSKALLEFGFLQMTSDPCLYILRRGSHIVVMGVFVDDFILFGTLEALVNEVKAMLASKFKTKDLGKARWVLGMRLMQTASAYVLDQAQYTASVIARFAKHMNKMKMPKVPVPVKFDLRRAKPDEAVAEFPYRELVGAIGHLAIGTRIDLAYAVSMLSRFVAHPGQKDWDACLHVLQYLKNSDPVGLVFKVGKVVSKFDPELLNGDDGSWLDAAVDSDFANDPDTLKSVGGYVVRLGGTAISWRSKMMNLVGTSTFHAEYMEAYEGTREVTWARMLLEGIGFKLRYPTAMLEDNATAAQTAKSEGISDASKHVQVKYHWVREAVKLGVVDIQSVKSRDNPADSLTKAPTTASLGVTRQWAQLLLVGPYEVQDVPSDQGG